MPSRVWQSRTTDNMKSTNLTLQTLFNEVFGPIAMVVTTTPQTMPPTPLTVFDAIVEEIETKNLRPAWCILTMNLPAYGLLTYNEAVRLRTTFGIVCLHSGLDGVCFIVTEVKHGS